MPIVPEVIDTFDKLKELHKKKNDDYAESDNPFSNFDVAEDGLALFANDRDKVFAWPIFTKLARLGNLLSSVREPNNESIEDSFDDIIVYAALWKADVIRRRKSLPTR